MRNVTCSLAPGTDDLFGGSSTGFVVAALNAASAASREVVVLRVISLSSFLGISTKKHAGCRFVTFRSGPRGTVDHDEVSWCSHAAVLSIEIDVA